ncbi:MAG: 50S ribosomal protein L29 [Chloroflexi bacterium]|nr:50S ribosomal protein L29 [Chloroflexota bacterium]
MNAAELVKMDDASLKKQLDDFEHEHFNLRFQRAAGQLTNLNRLAQVRRDIARVKTIIRAREIVARRPIKEQAQ